MLPRVHCYELSPRQNRINQWERIVILVHRPSRHNIGFSAKNPFVCTTVNKLVVSQLGVCVCVGGGGGGRWGGQKMCSSLNPLSHNINMNVLSQASINLSWY